MDQNHFFYKLEQQCVKKNSQLCIGLDPRVIIKDTTENTIIKLINDCHNIINSTIDVACCYKPNIAFFEAFGPPGLVALKEIISHIHELDSLVILDCKRGDIGSTAKSYAKMCYDYLNADCVTISPFLGYDSIGPFISDDYQGKGAFVLCCTSNPSAFEVQSDNVIKRIAKLSCNNGDWGKQTIDSSLPLGLVIGATQPDIIKYVRQNNNDSWFLTPGIGTQGGNIEIMFHSLIDYPESLHKMIVPISRAISQADDIKSTAKMYKDNINHAILETKELYSI